jgi:hypothetical protein
MAGRGIDHLVLAVRDLGHGAALYERMGFTLTPQAQHPFGTGNRLAQLQGGFLEVLGVTRPELIADAGPGEFSFGAYNRDFLASREGFSMIAFESAGPDRDRAAFEAAGLEVAAPFAFTRMARQPDGSEVEMGFDLTFVPRETAPAAAIFTCSHRHKPEQFYKPAYQSHANGALRIKSVAIETADPVATNAFLAAMDVDPALFEVDVGVVSGERLAGYAVTVEDTTAAAGALRAGGVAFEVDGENLTVGPDAGLGTRITFCKESKQ